MGMTLELAYISPKRMLELVQQARQRDLAQQAYYKLWPHDPLETHHSRLVFDMPAQVSRGTGGRDAAHCYTYETVHGCARGYKRNQKGAL